MPATTVVYSPYSGFTPDAMANAMPSGMAIRPTMMPETRSLRSFSHPYPPVPSEGCNPDAPLFSLDFMEYEYLNVQIYKRQDTSYSRFLPAVKGGICVNPVISPRISACCPSRSSLPDFAPRTLREGSRTARIPCRNPGRPCYFPFTAVRCAFLQAAGSGRSDGCRKSVSPPAADP